MDKNKKYNAQTSVLEVIKRLREEGVHVYLHEGKLKTKASAEAITPEISAIIKENKPLIISYLSGKGVSIQSYLNRLENNSKPAPLSFAQLRIWLLDQFEGSSIHYNMPLALRLKGKFDYGAFAKTFNTILERHEVLRTCYLKDEQGDPVQVIQEHRNITVAVDDIQAFSEAERNRQVESLAFEEAETPFDLSRDLMIRMKILKLQESEHVIFITMHHIASDGWSMGVLVNEIGELYHAYSQAQGNPLQPLLLQYADYARWQRSWLQGDVLEQQLDYWKLQLAGLPRLHSLPTDYKRPKIQGIRGARVKSAISKTVLNTLKGLCHQNDATLFMGLHALFSVLLSRYSNETDIVVGTPIANREQSEVAPLIGFFLNTLVLRSDLSNNPDFETLLQESQKTLLGAYMHQQVPFEKLVEVLQPERSMSHNPLFQVALVLQNYDGGDLSLPELSLSHIESEEITVKCDLILNVAEHDDGLALSWNYNKELFLPESVERMAAHFVDIAERLCAVPSLKVLDFHLLSKEQQVQQLRSRNTGLSENRLDLCTHQLFEEQVARNPDAPAIVFEGKTLSYGQLNEKANRLARYLIESKDLTPETLVGVCLDRSADMFIAMLAILKAGGAYLPLDPDYPQDRLAYMQDDAGLEIILTDSTLLFYLPFHHGSLVFLDDPDLMSQLEQLPGHNIGAGTLGLTPDHLAYCIYTSGSTGKPKGVLLAHKGAVNLAQSLRKAFEVTERSRVLHFASISFDAATWEWLMALANGASLILCTREQQRQQQKLASLLVAQKITHATLPPAVLKHLGFSDDYFFEYLIVAGESCDEELAHQWSKRFNLINAYGPTETTVCATMTPMRAKQNNNIGYPIDNMQTYVLSERLQLLPTGVIGELYVGGVGLARGYLNRPDLTAERFIVNPYVDDSEVYSPKLYKTGDLVRRLPTGELEYLGRNDHQVKIRGHRIELGEIESAILNHNDISEVLVTTKAGATGDQQLIGYYRSSKDIAPSHLKAWLKEQLPEYMVPAFLVALAKFPLNSNGKIDRVALPAPDISAIQTEYVAARTETEQELCVMWQELFSVERVGIKDSFFDLGGHSLLVTKQLVMLQQRFGVDVAMKEIFDQPNIESLARLIEIELKLKSQMERSHTHKEEGAEVWEL